MTSRSLFAVAVMMVLSYMAFIAWLATDTGWHTLLFPELGALAYDVFTRPAGTWAKAPIHMVLTPTITAILGIFIARYFPFGLMAVLLSVGSTAIILRLLQSPIAPAFSAGLLPLVLGWTTVWYPPSILFGLLCLGLLGVASGNGI